MKIIINGLAAGAAMLLTSLVTMPVWNVLFPGIQQEYINPALFRPWSDPLMSLIFVHPFIVGIILAWIWTKIKHIFKQESLFKKGVSFGLTYGILTLPGMFISYSTFPVSIYMIMSWTVGGLLQDVIGGIVIARTDR